MICLVHKDNRPLRVIKDLKDVISFEFENTVGATLFKLAKAYTDELLLWCDEDCTADMSEKNINDIFHHRRIMASYSVSRKTFLSSRIGYVEDTPFINPKFDLPYPTWLMSPDIGGIHSEVLLKFDAIEYKEKNFGYVLNSLAKLGMRRGLFCYSDPRLVRSGAVKKGDDRGLTTFGLFRFIKQHYKKKWLLFAFASFVFFERRLPLLPFLSAWFFKGKKSSPSVIDDIELQTNLKIEERNSYDVIIPTIGRKKYLYDYLQDLKSQNPLPVKVIVIEQNPDSASATELDFLTSETWPFELVHHFIHRTGACNARNMALKEVTADWVVLGDDDNRVTTNVYPEMIARARQLGVKVLTAAYLQPEEVQTYHYEEQTTVFGSGSSIMHASLIPHLAFDLGYEFGYGEDVDFGMQIRNLGEDVIYYPKTVITHLKAPMGGFRTKFVHPWEEEAIKPLPSPTIMLYNLKHRTDEQLNGYKLFFFSKYYKKQAVKNPWKYVRLMNKRWARSTHWAKELRNKSNRDV